METKAELRARMKEARKRIRSREEQEQAVCRAIRASEEYERAGTLLLYLALGTELDLTGLIRAAEADRKIIGIPVAWRDGAMEFFPWRRGEPLEKGLFGTLVPRRKTAVIKPDAGALLIAPGLAFSPDGLRLGYGGGYYDAYLARHPLFSVGAAFEEQIVRELPFDRNDRPLKKIVTAGGSYDCLCGGRFTAH